MTTPFRPALLVIDLQEDFCPPNGSLAVNGGREIASTINNLLHRPFHLKIATQDWHPANHISFASNHSPPNNKPFECTATITNPLNPHETQTTRLWPVHCVQSTSGAELIPELDKSVLDTIVQKGTDARVEMYSAFRDPFRTPCVSESGLLGLLREKEISHCFVVGLAADYCVKETAIHAAEAGFVTFVVREGTRAVDQSETALEQLERDLEERGVKFVAVDGGEVAQVEALRTQ